ncbi:MAG: hypothetical protein ACPHN2_11135 [Sinimarinibacterium flocculans]|uniref:hypothetical protein n=1 Tax=Sinimarinibacterium flocculans TaxID=985250 RepID=UPI003C3AC818
MIGEAPKHYVKVLAIVAGTGVLLSLFWQIPYVFTAIGFSAWAFLGHLITADDDARGGWSNPDGSLPFPWAELAIKGVVLAGLCGVAAFFPGVRAFGGAS